MSTKPLGPGEGETLPVGPASHVEIKADAAASGGTLYVGEVTAGPGTFAVAAAPARFLNFNTPGGFEAYMRELAAAAADGPVPPARMGEIASRYDVRVV